MIEGFLDILKRKIKKYNKELYSADDLVLLETCAIKGLINYSDFISLSNILQVSYNFAIIITVIVI